MISSPATRATALGLILAAVAFAAYALTFGRDDGGGRTLASEGSVRYMKSARPEFDRYSSDPKWTGWINERFWRMRTYTPYFDAKTAGYSRGWFYRNLYGIAKDSSIARDHPEWILKDPAGTRLYIPWGCGGGTCPLLAADVGNPEYRAWWLTEAKRTLDRGYKGIWIDDANLLFRVADGNSQHVAPVDPRGGGATMTEATWRRNIADFLEKIRVEIPGDELTQNAIWFAPESDPHVARALEAADYINLERGVNDPGLVAGRGTYGFASLLDFIDRRHANGQGVVFDAYAETLPEREYGLASYFLVNNGTDAYSNVTGSAPDDWWRGFDVELGDAEARRYEWKGLLRRDFEDGLVLVNPPGGAPVSAELGGFFRDLGGRTVRRVDLGPARGIVLRRP